MRTARVRGRAAFAALRQRGVRSRRRAVQLTHVPGDPPAAVAFAIGKPVGTAVVRNRLRRRLRAILAELAPAGGTYLVIATPAAAQLPYSELKAQVSACLDDLAGAAA